MRYQPNAIHDSIDGRMQLAALTALRTMLSTLVNRETQGGPFVLSLTDVNVSNIFVDGEWRITSFIDLEFACVLPAQMQTVPYWLTDQAIDGLTGAHLEESKIFYDEFIDAVKQEETTRALDG